MAYMSYCSLRNFSMGAATGDRVVWGWGGLPEIETEAQNAL